MKKFLIALFLLVFVFGILGAGFAYAGPANPTFFESIKDWFGDIFTFGASAKAERHIKKADAILQDIKAMGDVSEEVEKKAAGLYSGRIRDAQKYFLKALSKEGDLPGLSQMIKEITDSHIDGFGGAEAKPTARARELGLDRALQVLKAINVRARNVLGEVQERKEIREISPDPFGAFEPIYLSSKDLVGLWRGKEELTIGKTSGEVISRRSLVHQDAYLAFRDEEMCENVTEGSQGLYCGGVYASYEIEKGILHPAKGALSGTDFEISVKDGRLTVLIKSEGKKLVMEKVSVEIVPVGSIELESSSVPVSMPVPTPALIPTPVPSKAPVEPITLPPSPGPSSPTPIEVPDYTVDISQDAFGLLWSGSGAEELEANVNVSFGAIVNDLGAPSNKATTVKFRLDVDNDGSWDIVREEIIGAMDFEPPLFYTVWFGTKGGAWVSKSGTHKYEICADSTNAIAESNENNNCAGEVFIIK